MEDILKATVRVRNKEKRTTGFIVDICLRQRRKNERTDKVLFFFA